MSRTSKALELLVSFGLAYLLEWALREPVQQFCQNQEYPVLVACLYLENPIFVLVIAFLILFGGFELARLELGSWLDRLGRKVRGWLEGL